MKRTDTNPQESNKNASVTPRSVVALGGGTGLPNVLRGLRSMLHRGEVDEVCAVVTMTDDGGSSGRLRKSRGLPPPGDLRNCLVALAEEEDLMARLFQHRYRGSEELGGHTVGNLILAALAEQTGCFLKAVELSSHVLKVVGRILPATLESVSLRAKMDDGSTLVGETRIAASPKAIRRLFLKPQHARPTPGVLDAIRNADIVVLGPGSLFTSVAASVLVDGIGAALRETRGLVILVTNMVSEPGEEAGRDLAAHLRVVEEHGGGRFVKAMLVHRGPIDAATLARYEKEGSRPLEMRDTAVRGVRIERRNLLAPGRKIRHDPERTLAAIVDLWREHTSIAEPVKAS